MCTNFGNTFFEIDPKCESEHLAILGNDSDYVDLVFANEDGLSTHKGAALFHVHISINAFLSRSLIHLKQLDVICN